MTTWQIGDRVDVGFVKGLKVVFKYTGGEWALEGRNGALYSFIAHRGLRRI